MKLSLVLLAAFVFTTAYAQSDAQSVESPAALSKQNKAKGSKTAIGTPSKRNGGGSLDICIIGKLYTAVQGAVSSHCRACSSYLQCYGSQQAVYSCGNEPLAIPDDDEEHESSEEEDIDEIEEDLGATLDQDDSYESDEKKTKKVKKVKKSKKSSKSSKNSLKPKFIDADVADAVSDITSGDDWSDYLRESIGIRVDANAARMGRAGRNCYANYGMFRGCIMPSLCLGFAAN